MVTTEEADVNHRRHMRYLLIFFLSLPWACLAQEHQQLLLLEAAELSQETLTKPVDPASPLGECADPQVQEQLTCVSDNPPLNPADYTTFMLEYPSAKDLPGMIKQQLPGALLEGNTNGAVKVVIALPNDNKLLGMWGTIFNQDGDDDGYTHGSSVTISSTNQKGQTLTLQGGTDVYTQDAGNSAWWTPEGTIADEAYFTNDNFVKLIADNIHQNKATYWKAGVGWQQLDSKNWKSILTGTGQQYRWHDFLQENVDKTMAYDPVYLENGKGVSNGITLEAFFGLQNNFVFGNSSCRLKSYVEGGGQLGTLGSSYFQLQGGTTMFLQKPGSRFSTFAGVGVTGKVFDGGSNVTVQPSVGVNYGRFDLSFVYQKAWGGLPNHVDYNIKNKGKIDDIMSVRIGIVIGKFRRK